MIAEKCLHNRRKNTVYDRTSFDENNSITKMYTLNWQKGHSVDEKTKHD